MIAFLIVVYVVFAPVIYAASFAYWQRRWEFIAVENYHSDMLFSICMAALPPCWVVVFMCCIRQNYGLKFR